MEWDFEDQLHHVEKGNVMAYYTYDAAGERVRKVVEKNGGTLIEERIYLGGFEIFRKHNGSGIVLERETLHIMDDQQRIAMVETRTVGTQDVDRAPRQLIRYQLGNHLGSASLELDDGGQVISYEEYYPYGSTSYQAVRSQTETPKRYRYTGKERDEESGFNYHSARYYVSWLGRWLKPDPSGIQDTMNSYQYVSGNPIKLIDPSGLSGWDRFLGGVKMVAGGIETAVGATLVGVGIASSEIGIGIPIAAAGAFVTAHGADVTVSGARTMWNGAPVETLTSQGLQAAGMSRRAANLTDAGISVVGTLGASLAIRAPAVAPSVSLAFRPALGAGHNMVGVTTSEGTTAWTHLVVNAPRTTSGVVTSGEALVVASEAGPTIGYATVRVPVAAAQAEAALTTATSAVRASTALEAAGTPAVYSLCANNCATYTASVLNSAGVVTPSVTSPLLNFTATALQSPRVMQTLTTAGAALRTTEAVASVSRSSTTRGPATSSSSGIPNSADYHTFDEFAAAAGGPYSEQFLMERWAEVHGWVSSD